MLRWAGVPQWLRTTLRLTSLVVDRRRGQHRRAWSCSGTSSTSSTLRGSSDSLGTYLQTLGGIYAVLLAFVVVVVWGQFNDARSYVNREANALVDLHRTASGLPDDARDDDPAGPARLRRRACSPTSGAR